MNQTIRITSDGTRGGTHITHIESGVDIRADVVGISIDMSPRSQNKAIIKMVRPLVDVIAQAEVVLVRPRWWQRICRFFTGRRPMACVFGEGLNAEYAILHHEGE